MQPERQLKLAGFVGITAGVSLVTVHALVYSAWSEQFPQSISFAARLDSLDALMLLLPLVAGMAVVAGSVATLRGRSRGRIVVAISAGIALLMGVWTFMTYGFGLRYPVVSVSVIWGMALIVLFNADSVRRTPDADNRLWRTEKIGCVLLGFLALVLCAWYGVGAWFFIRGMDDPFHTPRQIVLPAPNADDAPTRRFHDAALRIPTGFSVGYVDHRGWPPEMGKPPTEPNDDTLILQNRDRTVQLLFATDATFEISGRRFGYRNGYEFGAALTHERVGMVFHMMRALFHATFDDVTVGDWKGFKRTSRRLVNGKETHAFHLWHQPTGAALELTAFVKPDPANVDAVERIVATLKYDPTPPDAARHLARGKELIADGRVEDAKFEIAIALLTDWNNPDAQLRMGEALLLSGRPGAAQMYIDNALRLEPDFHEAEEMKTRAAAAEKEKRAREGTPDSGQCTE
ncbi:MAG: hypothetical protein HY897_16125 [Deltaproteobacteria bacterium]|nr:hypothetical protein [Deltaproteobacteria bacterium]